MTGGVVTLLDHTFKVFDLTKGTLEKKTVTDFAAYVRNLKEHLGVELDDTEIAVLKSRFATLKPAEG